MPPLSCARLGSFTVLAALFAACAGGGPVRRAAVAVEPRQATRVSLTQLSPMQALVLTTRGGRSQAEIFESNPPDALLKVLDDGEMQGLIDVLDQQGMFAATRSMPPPDARDVLVVEHGDRRWLWWRTKALGQQPDEMPFHQAKAAFLAVYNDAMAFRDGRGTDFEAERQRTRAAGESARQKLLQLQGARQ